MMLAKSFIAGNISTTDCAPNNPGEVNTLLIAISKPPATNAGINGTKISDKTLIKLITGLGFFPLLATSLSFSVEVPCTSVIFNISA